MPTCTVGCETKVDLDISSLGRLVKKMTLFSIYMKMTSRSEGSSLSHSDTMTGKLKKNVRRSSRGDKNKYKTKFELVLAELPKFKLNKLC